MVGLLKRKFQEWMTAEEWVAGDAKRNEHNRRMKVKKALWAIEGDNDFAPVARLEGNNDENHPEKFLESSPHITLQRICQGRVQRAQFSHRICLTNVRARVAPRRFQSAWLGNQQTTFTLGLQDLGVSVVFACVCAPECHH